MCGIIVLDTSLAKNIVTPFCGKAVNVLKLELLSKCYLNMCAVVYVLHKLVPHYRSAIKVRFHNA